MELLGLDPPVAEEISLRGLSQISPVSPVTSLVLTVILLRANVVYVFPVKKSRSD